VYWDFVALGVSEDCERREIFIKEKKLPETLVQE
jgi:hypothetical protein